MKHFLANLINQKLSVVLLLCGMLALSNTAWGTTYYIDATSYTDDGYTILINSDTRLRVNGNELHPSSVTDCTGVLYFECDGGTVTEAQLRISKGGMNYSVGVNGISISLSYNTLQTSGTSTSSLSLSNVSGYTCGSSGYTVNSSVSANGTITPSGSNSVSSSQTYTVSLNTGYKVSSVTNTTGGTLDPTASALEGRYGNFTVTLSSPTSDGNLTITTTARTSYSVTVSASGGTVSPSSAQTIYQGDSKNFTVTPEAGFVYKGYTTSGGFAGTVSKSDNTFTVTPTSGGTVTISYGSPGTDLPVVRIGEKIDQDPSNNDVVTSAYITSEKCINVDEIVVYYANNSAFRTEGSMVTKTKSFTSGSPYTLKTTHSLTLTASEVSSIVEDGETLYVRMKAHNSNGYSAYSDIVSLVYENKNFIAENQEKLDADACDGNHEFTWSDMFTPAPAYEDCSVVDASGKNVKDQFTLTSDGKMVWNVIESSEDDKITIKENGTYVFTFTGKKKGYTPADATFTVTLTTTSTTDEISGICVDPGTSPVTEYGDLTPWQSATLTASETSGEIAKIGWTVSPISDNYILTPTEGTSVMFKGKSAGDFTVTARGLTSTCGSSAYKTLKLTVNNDSEPCD